MDFGDEVGHATDDPVDELSTRTETLADRVPEGDTRIGSETEGVTIVGIEPKLQLSEAYALVLGHCMLRVNSVQILQRSQAFQGEFSQIEIPLCRMITLHVVRPALAKDIEKMKADFVHGYRPGAAVFYVSTTNFGGEERFVTNVDRLSWDVHWQRRDDEFESFLSLHNELHELSNKFFFIWDGNHRHQAWTEFIAQSHSTEFNWHYRVRTIILKTREDVASIFTAMHDINKATENFHVKTNFVHTLHRMQKVGLLPVSSFHDLLSTEEIIAAKKIAESVGDKKPWYPIPRSKFLDYIYSVSSLSTSAQIGSEFTLCIVKHNAYLGDVFANWFSSKSSQKQATKRSESTRTRQRRIVAPP